MNRSYEMQEISDMELTLKTGPPCPVHARSGLVVCNKCCRTILCMKCDTIACQCEFVTDMED